MRDEQMIIGDFLKWAENKDNVRSAILTSSRVHDGADIDFLSDYDIEIYVSDLSFFEDDSWLNYFGNVMVKWPFKPKSTFSESWITRLVLFDNGIRIDFQISGLKEVDVTRYDNGYKVLVDKDNMAEAIPKPSYQEFIIRKPTEEEYLDVVNEFWWNAYYIPKYLWRDELPFAKYMLDNILRYEYLHKLIDWYIGYKNNWTVSTGALGKKYKAMLSSDVWKEFEECYAGGGIEENWEAFSKLTNFFRRIAKGLGDNIGYIYPQKVDAEVMAFCLKIKNTGK